MINIKNLSFSYYKGIETIKNISCSFNESSITAIIGPNGSGKSTFLELIANMLPKYNGTISIQTDNLQHTDIKKIPAIERAKIIAYMEQNIPIIAGFTVEDIVQTGRFPYRKDKQVSPNTDFNIINYWINKMELNDVRKTRIDRLSGGFIQRALITKIFAQDTDIIILDEPYASLDIKQNLLLNKTLLDLKKKGKTIIITVHDVNTALNIADNFILIKEGKLLNSCKKQDLNQSMLEQLYDCKCKLTTVDNKLYLLF